VTHWSSIDDRDMRIRGAAFEFVARLASVHGEEIPYEVLKRGFPFESDRVLLLSQQGIFKPRQLELPLSISTRVRADGTAPYADEFGGGPYISYCYQDSPTKQHENEGLRRLAGRPLIYFVRAREESPVLYKAHWPALVVSDDPAARRFEIAIDDEAYALPALGMPRDDADTQVRRRYVTTLRKQRLHQDGFRTRVLSAYQDRCCVCRFGHRKLLDAAHIIRDGDPGGDPVVPNGLSLCKIHHAAYDGNFLGLRPDGVIEIRDDLLREKDGPMLEHGLQRLHGTPARFPHPSRLRPDVARLERRYAEFRHAV
jgi:putative restriction endonuclease